jgi:hypothetical protein
MISPFSIKRSYENALLFSYGRWRVQKARFFRMRRCRFFGGFFYTGIQAPAESTCRSYDAALGHCSVEGAYLSTTWWRAAEFY